jgi:Domain of unknown function (DUF4375)
LSVTLENCEVDNGLIEQFFSNSSGHFGPDALEWAREARHSDLAGLIDEALHLLGEPFPMDRVQRNARLRTIPHDEWDQLDRAYYAVDNASNLTAWMDQYV